MAPMCPDLCPCLGTFLDADMACVRKFLTALLVRGDGRQVKLGMRHSIWGAEMVTIIVVNGCLLLHRKDRDCCGGRIGPGL